MMVNQVRSVLAVNKTYFTLLFAALATLPVLLKLIATGAVGPTFNFYYFFFWVPATSIAMAALRGAWATAVAATCLVAAYALCVLSFPENGPMDFRRQILSQGQVYIPLAGLTALAFSLFQRDMKT